MDASAADAPKKKSSWWKWLLGAVAVLFVIGLLAGDEEGEAPGDADGTQALAQASTSDSYGGALLNVERAAAGASCYPDAGNECVTLTVSIRNGGSREFDTNMFHWEAEGAAKDIYKAPYRTSGPDAVAPGGAATVTLQFEVPRTTQLVELRYEIGFDGVATAKMAVPAY